MLKNWATRQSGRLEGVGARTRRISYITGEGGGEGGGGNVGLRGIKDLVVPDQYNEDGEVKRKGTIVVDGAKHEYKVPRRNPMDRGGPPVQPNFLVVPSKQKAAPRGRQLSDLLNADGLPAGLLRKRADMLAEPATRTRSQVSAFLDARALRSESAFSLGTGLVPGRDVPLLAPREAAMAAFSGFASRDSFNERDQLPMSQVTRPRPAAAPRAPTAPPLSATDPAWPRSLGATACVDSGGRWSGSRRNLSGTGRVRILRRCPERRITTPRASDASWRSQQTHPLAALLHAHPTAAPPPPGPPASASLPLLQRLPTQPSPSMLPLSDGPRCVLGLPPRARKAPSIPQWRLRPHSRRRLGAESLGRAMGLDRAMGQAASSSLLLAPPLPAPPRARASPAPPRPGGKGSPRLPSCIPAPRAPHPPSPLRAPSPPPELPPRARSRVPRTTARCLCPSRCVTPRAAHSALDAARAECSSSPAAAEHGGLGSGAAAGFG